MKLTQSDIDSLLKDVRGSLKKLKLTDDQYQEFTNTVFKVLDNYQKVLPEDTEIHCQIHSRSRRFHMTFFIPGQRLNPFEEGTAAPELVFFKKVNALVYRPLTDVNYHYSAGTNIITISLQNNVTNLHVLKNPMVLAAVLGLLLGLACHHLPNHISSFLADELASPIYRLIISMVSGVMGPIMFVSLLTSVIILDSINELNNHGLRLFRRFFNVALFITVVSCLVAIIMFPIFGANDIDFDPTMIVNLILSIFPTNLFTPFVDNNYPQLAILGLLMGAALLIISKKTPVLPSLLTEVRSWFNEIMDLVLKLMPAVPFLSIFAITAKGQFSLLFDGWRYILASYLCILICSILKLAKTSIKCKISPFSLLKKMGPLIELVFTAGNETIGLKKFYALSKNGFGIEPNFTFFWYPLNDAMMSPSSVIAFVLAPFLAAQLAGISVSTEFLLVLFLLTMQLALASPGMIPGITILLKALGLPMGFVGLFSAYNVFVMNANVAFCVFFQVLEQLEAAIELKQIDSSFLQKEASS